MEPDPWGSRSRAPVDAPERVKGGTVTQAEAQPQRTLTLSDRYEREDGQIYLSGLQALVRLPLDQRRRDERLGRNTAAFVSGYEGSPFAGYDLELARQRALLDGHGVVFRPGLNEELAVNAVQGRQLSS